MIKVIDSMFPSPLNVDTWTKKLETKLEKPKMTSYNNCKKRPVFLPKTQKIQKLQILMDTKTERLKFISAKPEKLN